VAVCVELIWSNWGLNPMTDELYRPSRPDTRDERSFWRAADDDATRYRDLLMFNDYYFVTRDDGLTLDERLRALRQSELANINLLDGSASFNNFDPLLIDHYARYLRLLNTVEANQGLLTAAHIDTVLEAGGTYRRSAWNIGRAYLISHEAVCWHETPESLEAAISDPDWQVGNQLHMLGDGGCGSPAMIAEWGAFIDAFSERSTRVTVTVNTDRLAWLVLADTDYPGWRAYIDGVEVPMYRANGMFRAVQVDDGAHTVEFAYTPAWLLPGMAISLISGVLMIALMRIRDETNDE